MMVQLHRETSYVKHFFLNNFPHLSINKQTSKKPEVACACNPDPGEVETVPPPGPAG